LGGRSQAVSRITPERGTSSRAPKADLNSAEYLIGRCLRQKEGGTVIETVEIERNDAGIGAHTGVDVADAIVESLARALELHDSYRGRFGETASHTLGVTELAVELAQHVAPELAANPQLRHGARLHDIGMIGVAPATLLKQGTLTRHEYEEIREHTWLGERIVAPVPLLNGVARQIIGSHHEKWNGSGYPRALRGTEIPVAARIVALADAFDAMTNGQPYRDPLPVSVALAEIESDAGSHFDPELSAALIRLIMDGSAAVHRRGGT
jgi:HD-GYP domain-containing protein (c-di-GMP phosphodiesterase class II)